MENQQKTKQKIGGFLFFVFAISSIFYYVMIDTGTARKVVGFWMWSPGIAAILTKIVFREKLQGMGWQLGKSKYLLLGLATPFLYSSMIYCVVWVTGLGEFTPLPFFKIVILATVGFVMACFVALGEEIGWRGFMIPELIKIMSFGKAALVTGIVWAVWHYPAILFADYNQETPLVFQIIVITVAIVGYSIFTAWLRMKSGSIWPVVIWHGVHNLFIQQIYLSMTIDTGITDYFIDDFGVGVLIASIILGIVFWRKLSELSEKNLVSSRAT